MKKLFATILILFFFGSVFAQDIEFLPSTIGEMTAQVKVVGSGSVIGLKSNQQVKMQIITFQDSAYQDVQFLQETIYINRKVITANTTYDEFNNKYAEFIIPENGNFRYEILANIKTTSIVHELTDYNLNNKILGENTYLLPSTKVESNSSEIATLTSNRFIKSSFIETLNETVGWVNDYVTYASGTDYQKYYRLQQTALETLRDKKGVCDEFANLGAAILRAKGIPTRLAIGITFDGRAWGNHAWIEVYQPNIGWIPSDPTFRESGFVDATHIKMGVFSDITLSLAKAIIPANADVIFDTPEIPEVNILDKQYFDEIELSSKSQILNAKEWNKITINVKNKTDKAITVPITLNNNYQELYVKNPRIDTMVKAGETKKVEFEIYPNIELGLYQVASGTGLTINSLGAPIEIPFQIKYSPNEDKGTVEVINITPLVSGNNLEIEAKIANYSPEKSQIRIKIFGDGAKINELVDINAFDFSKIITKTIEAFEEKIYTVEITTSTAIYTQEINPVKMESSELIISGQTNPAITQKVDTTNSNNGYALNINIDDPIAPLILVGLVIMLALITAYYLSQNPRYV
jgi:hypothetical protein